MLNINMQMNNYVLGHVDFTRKFLKGYTTNFFHKIQICSWYRTGIIYKKR